MKNRVLASILTAVVLLLIAGSGRAQDLVRNGGFEYPVVTGLSLMVDPAGGLPGWQTDFPVSVINHTRLFPHADYQCLLLPAGTGNNPAIRQSFSTMVRGKVNLTFAMTASRIASGTLVVLLDGKIIGSRNYADYWQPEETRLTDHMKWQVISLPGTFIDAGNHIIEFRQQQCRVVEDNQGDKRDMVAGFLIDQVAAVFQPQTWNYGVPDLDQLAGDWTEVKTLACYPTIGNFRGSIKSSKCLGSFETGFFAEGAQQVIGTLRSGDSVIFSRQSRWYPYQIKATSSFGPVEIMSTIRLVFEKQGILIQFNLYNPTGKTVPIPLSMALLSTAPDQVHKLSPSAVVVEAGRQSFAFGFSIPPDSISLTGNIPEANWSFDLEPGQTKNVSYVLAIDSDGQQAIANAGIWQENFAEFFQKARSLWETRWNDVFTPLNSSYSGHLPIFETDQRNLWELYYLSIVSFLQTQQNGVYPTLDIAFGSNNEWAANQAYFWEISQFADLYALLDPAGMKKLAGMCLLIDPDKGNAIDYRTGKIVNHWYAVNDYAIFKTIDSYIRINRDFGFLDSLFNGLTVRDHLYKLATAWEKRLDSASFLADYGKDPWSFFETNPDYIHFVPAMNAQNVWMLRTMATYSEIHGNGEHSRELREKAGRLASAVLSLYVPGEGVWRVRYPDGRTIVSRHSYDFLTIGATMTDDLTTRMKHEMTNFVLSELLTETGYMRAMSQKDQAALNSDRSDHGPAGSYTGWPALTIQAIAEFGQYEQAVLLLSDFRDAFRESGMGQAIELLVPPGKTKAINRIGARAGASFLLSGSDYANTIIDGLMGYKPSVRGTLLPYLDGKDRFFNGRLLHIRHGHDLYRIEASTDGISQQLTN